MELVIGILIPQPGTNWRAIFDKLMAAANRAYPSNNPVSAAGAGGPVANNAGDVGVGNNQGGGAGNNVEGGVGILATILELPREAAFRLEEEACSAPPRGGRYYRKKLSTADISEFLK